MRKSITFLTLIIIVSLLSPWNAYAKESDSEKESGSISYTESGTKQTPGGINYEDIATAIDEYIMEREGGLASYVVSIFDENGDIFNGYYGCADINGNIKADRDTVYEWGSCSKILVWISVMP